MELELLRNHSFTAGNYNLIQKKKKKKKAHVG